MSEYQEVIKENVFAYLSRMQEVKTETQIQASVNVSGRKLKAVEVATALKQLMDDNKVTHVGSNLYAVHSKARQIVTGRW